jgi:hypothetical protein
MDSKFLLTATALAAVLAYVAVVPFVSAQTEQRSAKARSRPDPAKYSLRIWSKNSLGMSPVSTMTPYGRLTCMGALMHDRPRSCHWD